MCQIEKDGYRMSDGTLIHFDADLSGIPVRYINEMNDNTPTAWDSFQTHKSLINMEKKILQRIDDHGIGCPMNPVAISNLVDKRIVETKVNTKKSMRENLKDILLLLTIIAQVVIIVKVFF